MRNLKLITNWFGVLNCHIRIRIASRKTITKIFQLFQYQNLN